MLWAEHSSNSTKSLLNYPNDFDRLALNRSALVLALLGAARGIVLLVAVWSLRIAV
jgi:hypothetical protein